MYSKGALEADSQFPPVATYLPTRLCLPCNTLRSCSFEGVYLTTHILWLEGRCGFLILDAQKIQADVARADLLLLPVGLESRKNDAVMLGQGPSM